jgi:hypothetical protein
MPAMLETSRVGRRRFAALAMLAGFAAGCAHFGEAFDERVSRGVSGRHVRIAWSCDGAPSGEAPSAASARVGLAVSGPPEQRGLLTRAAYLPADATGEIVGEVFGQGSRVRTAQPFALGLSGAPLATQLREAVAARLRSVGIELAAESPAAPSALAIAIAKVWVATSSGGFFSLKGDLVAEVVWTALREARPPPRRIRVRARPRGSARRGVVRRARRLRRSRTHGARAASLRLASRRAASVVA